MITPYSENTKEYLGSLKNLDMEGVKALAFTNVELNNQAAMMSINDCFYLMGWIFLGLILFLPLGRKRIA